MRGGNATGLPPAARRLGVAGLALVVLAACEPYIQGNGVYHEEDRSGAVGPFLGIRLEEGILAEVTAGAPDRSVVVSGDANVVRYLRTDVQQETVRGATIEVLRVFVDVSGGYSSTYPLRVRIRLPELRFASAEGDRARVDLRDDVTLELVLEARDSGEILVRGLGGPTLHATLADGEIDAGSYVVDTAEVTLTGDSRIELHADVEVTGEAWGTSVVDNLLGGGACNVVLHDAAALLCG